jgi:hypothetical protein
MDVHDCIAVIERMIDDTVEVAHQIHLIPGSERLNGQLGVGTRIAILADVKSELTKAAIAELENEAARG